MSALSVYLVLQLDSLVLCFALMSCALTIGSIMSLIYWSDTYGPKEQSAKRFAGRVLAATVIGWLLTTVTPSSKTAAAMIVLPAITSPDAIAKIEPEAQELYDLAKDALRSLAKKDGEEGK